MTDPTVFVVDDDPAVRESLSLLVGTMGLNVEAYDSARAFLDVYSPSRPGCLILDMRLPDVGGLDLLEKLANINAPIPVIVLTGHGDVPAAVQAMRTGAMDFIEKPCDSDRLLTRIRDAIDRDNKWRRQSADRTSVAERLAQLTAREREIMELIVDGKANKVIAMDLDISERTVELHRARIMKKMKVRTLAELIRLSVMHPPGHRHAAG